MIHFFKFLSQSLFRIFQIRQILVAALPLATLLSIVSCGSKPNTSPAPDRAVAYGRTNIPLRDFFRNSQQKDFSISPDGRYVSYLAPSEGRMNVFVQPRDKGQPAVQMTEIKDRDIVGQFWKGNHTLIYLRDFSGDENFQLFAVNVENKKTTALNPFKGVRAEIIDDLDQIDDENILVGLNRRKAEVFDVYRLNVSTGALKLIGENPGNIASWMTDHKGRLRLAITTDGVNNTILIRDSEKGKFKKLLTTSFKEKVAPLFYTFDDKNLYATSNRGRDKEALVTLDLKSGEEKVFFERPDVDVEGLSYSKKRHVLWTALFTTWHLERHFFDNEMSAIFQDVQSQLPGMEVGITGYDRAEKLFLIRTSSDTSRGSTYLYDVSTKKVDKLADAAPWIHPAEMSEMKPVEFKARDGLTIHGYLTIPRGAKAENLPVVVNPHGGPWARDEWGYNSEVQFLASRGYAVFQMNYRGSTGYGRQFWESSFKQWGKKMQDDITDGVNWLIQQKIANPKRIGIYGGSYGGYATLAGLTFTPELYACGVDYVGVSNLFTFMKSVPAYWKPFLQELYEQVGDPVKDKDLLTAASPVFHVDKIRAPLFVAQGAKDPRVNINESNQIVEALKKRGVNVQYMVKENEGHGFHNEENRFDFYGAMEKFLAEHL